MGLSKFKQEIEELYSGGLNAAQIARMINQILKDEKIKIATVQKYIQRNLHHKKKEHKIRAMENKEAIKAVHYEATKCMSDKAFVKQNRSIYRTKENGDIVVDRKVAPITTYDTPKRLVNENKAS